MFKSQLYIGLMSGTSADAVDAALVDMSGPPRLVEAYSQPLSSQLRTLIHSISAPGADEIDRMGDLDVKLGEQFAACVVALLTKAGIDRKDIMAIGSHGQTIRHRPPGARDAAFTLQVGDPNIIAELTGITTVADFRRRDMAAGGQGAPLVPAFHHALFHTDRTDRVVINIGGMANITWLPSEGLTLGFDTGPGNVLMDLWIQQHRQTAYDHNGAWAQTGQSLPDLLSDLLSEPFFQQLPPKSTGRERFNSSWLEGYLENLPYDPMPVDVQATLLQLTATTICDSVKKLSDSSKEVLVCGGGALNKHLMDSIQALLLGDCRVTTTAEHGVAPQWVEAMAFAWLAKQTLHRIPGNLCEVTGARREVILGGVYYA